MKDETTASLQIVEVEGVRGYVDAQGIVWLNAEDVARGLGFVKVEDKFSTTVSTTSGRKTYTTVRWARVNNYLKEFNIEPVGKGDYISEYVFYLLAMKANNDVAKAFQLKIAKEILPSIRQTGSYSLTAAPASVVKPAAEKIDLARVYLILLSDGTIQIVKIGQSNNIRSRVAKIERETGLKVIGMYFTPPLLRETARLVEWASQKILSSQRVKGEFFSVEFSEAKKTIDYFVELATAEMPSGYFGRGENIFTIVDK